MNIGIDQLSFYTPHYYPELAELAAAVQHIFRENRDIALALAGLPDEVNALLKHRGITFIRRADHRELGAVTREEARRGLVEPVEENGWHWDETALNRALEATRGYPFMIQLIGHHSWLAAKNPTVIDDQAVEHGTQRALKDLNTLVLKPLVAELSGLDLAFVKAMAEDPGPSKVSDIAARIDRYSCPVSTPPHRSPHCCSGVPWGRRLYHSRTTGIPSHRRGPCPNPILVVSRRCSQAIPDSLAEYHQKLGIVPDAGTTHIVWRFWDGMFQRGHRPQFGPTDRRGRVQKPPAPRWRV